MDIGRAIATPFLWPSTGGCALSELVFRGASAIVTVDGADRVLAGDVAALDGVLTHVGGAYQPTTASPIVIDCRDLVVMPGIVQAHTHLCQTLARGAADDLELMDWLERRIWPYEAALTPATMRLAAELGIAELLLSGTTAILDMASVHHTDEVFAAAEASGIRATIGKALMDEPAPNIPPGLREGTRHAMDETAALIKRWHQAADGRLRYAIAPRFVLSCTQSALEESAHLAQTMDVRLHTHASENRREIELVEARFGRGNLHVLQAAGMLTSRLAVAHCVHIDEADRAMLCASGSHVVHCPSSNLKLASGICDVPALLRANVSVALGADGAPCNNNLDGFGEMRLAALLHKPAAGPTAIPAATALRLATQGGANALGLGEQVGSLTVGKRADLIAVALHQPHVIPSPDPVSAIVYAARGSDVQHVAVNGRVVVRARELQTIDLARTNAESTRAAHAIWSHLR